MLLLMKKLLGIVVLCLLWCNVSYGALFYGKETLPVVSKPDGADCSLKNNKGSWKVTTPAIIELKLSKKDLEIVCKKDGFKTISINLPLKDKNDFGPSYNYDHVQIIDDDDFVLDSVFAAISNHPVEIAFVVIDHGVNIIKSTGTLIKNTAIKTGEIFGSVKKKIKGDSTYANALIKSQRLDQKISKSSIQKAKKGSYYSMIYIELEKN